MIKVAIIYKSGELKGEVFNTFGEAETYILLESEKGVKRADAVEIGKPETRRTLWKD